MICSLFMAVALALYYYASPATYAYNVWRDSKNKPEMWQIPQRLSLDASVPDSVKHVSFHGASFSTSWSDSKVVREFDWGGLLTFGDTRSILFLGIAREPVDFRTLSLKYNDGWLKGIVSEQDMRSSYDLERDVLSTSPGVLPFSLNRKSMVRRSMFLTAKWICAGRGETGIYEFQTERTRGFQKGNPEKTGSVVLDVYDRNDRMTTIIISSTTKSVKRLTQSEVNTFLESLEIDPNLPTQSSWR